MTNMAIFKRSALTLGALALAAVGLAQGSFTIVRPADNSRVREKVKVLIPKGSIPSGAYVGVFLDNQFVEAIRPPLVGNYYQYILDTKGRGIQDTKPGEKLKLELRLYNDAAGESRIIDRSSVDIAVANRANIPISNDGLRLRYNWKNGTETVYNLLIRQTLETIGEAANKAGGKAAELPLDFEKIRLLYSVDNVYAGGTGLIRLQPLPTKGKTFAVLTTSGSEEPKVYEREDMAPVYMKVTSTGEQTFGTIPQFYAFDGFDGSNADRTTLLLASFPLPSLPTKSVRVGDVWSSRFQDGFLDLERGADTTSIVRTYPAKGEFLRTEWEAGHPCAVLKNSIETAATSIEARKMKKAGATISGDDKVKLDETIWFALDTRQVIKVIRDQTTETKIQTGASGGFGGPGGPGGPPASAPSGGRRGAGSPSGGASSGFVGPLPIRQQGGRGSARPPGGRGPGGRGSSGGPGGPGGFGPGGRSAPPAVQNVYLRIRTQRIFTLER